ncbi:MAG: glycosyltransferase family 2 protein, partial [Verrucomicrobiota bacterium]|nr:glycosyltransferase family 2 protein [Verrucomicrobiota bacterium]
MSDSALSVIVLTRNEERDLARCLEAARNLGPIIVVDSGSTDRTREIAIANHARVFEHPFASFGQQRNWALTNCEITTEWVLFLDADEIATPEFCRAIIDATKNAPANIAGFYCCWKTLLDGTWLRRSDSFPKWQFRLLRRGHATFRDVGHGQKEGTWDGEIGYIAEPYVHDAFSKGWEDWRAKHERYATQEAIDRSARAICGRDL